VAVPRKTANRFRERAEVLDFLLEVAAVTSQTLDMDELLADVAQIVRKVLPYDLFAILLFSERKQELRIRHAVGHRLEVVKNVSIAMGEGITGAAAAHRESILVDDVRKDPRYLNALDPVRSELAVPMLVRNRLVGVIDVQSTRVGAYNEYDRAMLTLIAGRVVTAIDNARLYRRVERQNRGLRLLARTSQEFSAILDLDDLLSTIAASIRQLINYDAFSILLVDHEQNALRHRFSMRYDERVKIDNIPIGSGITGAAAHSREAVRVHDVSSDPRYIASHPDICSEIAIPLIVQDRVVGVMDLESSQLRFFTDDHLRLLLFLAPQIASSVENARLYEAIAADLHAARDLQTVLLPSEAPRMDGLEAGIGLRPAREISGDLYDFYEYGTDAHPDPHVVIAFGDSSGKGAAAALYGAVLHGLMRTLLIKRRQPSDLMRALNDSLLERKVEARYVTLLLLMWHPHSLQFTLANAGANPPMVCRNGEILQMQAEGVPVGLLPDQTYDSTDFQAVPGDLIVLYSDGISDHQSSSAEEYGRGRLAQVVRTSCGRKPKQIVDAIFADLDAFNPVRFDDQTVIVLKVAG
jgi:sigma-B regulation protein RsbU (phosphoserine phosphatase)